MHFGGREGRRFRRYEAVARVLALIAAAIGVGLAGPARGAFRFGAYETTIGDLVDPAQAVVAPDGRIIVLESGRGVVSLFSRTGERLGGFGAPGSAPGQLVAPRGLALGPGGTLFVADTGNQRVQRFSLDGVALGAWGAYGSGEGDFNEPTGIAVDEARVYVADLGNHRVQMFDHAGRFLGAFGRRGDEDGAFNRPVDVAVDDAGFIYVADTDNNRVQKFDAGGAFVRSWGDWGPFRGLMDEPSAIVARDGELFIADTRNHRVQITSPDGEVLLQWGMHALVSHQGDGKLHYPNDIAIAPAGDFAVICESFENRCQIFAAMPEGETPDAGRLMAPKVNTSHFGERIDLDGKLLTISEPEMHRVQLFELSKEIPIVIGDFGERGKRFGQMIRAAGLEVDVAARRLYLADISTRRIQVFALDYDPEDARRFSRDRGNFSKAYDLARMGAALSSAGLEWVIEPLEIERDHEGNIYIVDARNSMILVFDDGMRLLRTWGGYGTAVGRFRGPNDIAFGRDGETVFVVDSNNHRIQVFDREGRFLRAWGSPGTGDGQFRQAFGIAAGRDGFVYVTDAGRDRVQKFTEDGRFVTAWGRRGTDHGEFWKPKGIEQGEDLRLFLVDQGNHRAQIFTPDGEWQVTFSLGRAYAASDPRFQRERAVEEQRKREQAKEDP